MKFRSVVGRKLSIDRPSQLEQEGDFFWMTDSKDAISFVCLAPSDPDTLPIIMPVTLDPTDDLRNGYEGKNWLWDGNVDKPTLKPSLGVRDCKAWHGYIRAGRFEACE